MFETIVALATPPFKSALAIIRCSGDDCFEVVNKCFSKSILDIKERTLLFGSIVDKNNNKKIDDVVLAIYKGPKSFTGEDSVEIMCHGSNLISNQIIELLLSNGARLATNGEFSSRSFLHKKMDLVQAEAINDMINATTDEAKNISLLALSGETSNLIKPIKKELGDIISLIEVNIDFPEYQDIEIANKEQIVSSCDNLINKINTLIDDGEKAQIIKDGVNVAIVGKPNVGKSSLLNAFLKKNKAIVTDIAGTTRDIVEGDVNCNGVILHLLDTAGIRDIDDKVESIGVNKSKETINEADIVIVLLDASAPLDDLDNEILELSEDKNRIIVYNKLDKAGKKEPKNLYISALNGEIEPLKDEIYKRIGLDVSNFKKPALNNTRQIGLLRKAKEELLIAKQDALNNLTVDLISISLMNAFNAILEILGEANHFDLSKEIFSRFCVGK